MNCEYDVENNCLLVDEKEITAYDIEENEIGACGDCQSELMSISYHSSETGTLVVSKCANCNAMCIVSYDSEWNWIEEIPITQFYSSTCDQEESVVNKELELLESIPIKRLKCVFSQTELDSMFAKAKGEKYVRQYLSRARKKYSDFEELFEIKLEI